MTADLARLLRRWAMLPENHRAAVVEAIEMSDDFDSSDQVAIDLLEEAARVGAELEGQHAREVAERIAEEGRKVERLARYALEGRGPRPCGNTVHDGCCTRLEDM